MQEDEMYDTSTSTIHAELFEDDIDNINYEPEEINYEYDESFGY